MKNDIQNTKYLISLNLNYQMKQLGKSRKEVCNDLDIKYTTFCDWANGKTYPRIESLEKLASYFGIAVGDFFIDIEENNKMEERIMSYIDKLVEMPLEFATTLTEEQLKHLLSLGVRLKKKSLEDYIKETGHETMWTSDEVDWGNPVEGELW